jgi:hypothetical protein
MEAADDDLPPELRDGEAHDTPLWIDGPRADEKRGGENERHTTPDANRRTTVNAAGGRASWEPSSSLAATAAH